MAEPLTSSDVWRLERGLGASPMASQEERKRLYSAGELPMSSSDIVRMAEGRGISPMASQAEKEAWVAGEVQAGRRPQTDLPKAYGGLGERPEASTRRGLRMQQEWDKQYELITAGQEIARQQEKEAKDFEMRQRDQLLQENDFYYNRGLKEAEQKLKAQQLAQAANIANGLANLDPSSLDWSEKAARIFAENPLGAEDQGVQKIASQYGAANNIYISSAQKALESSQAIQKSVIEAQNKWLEAGGSQDEIARVTKMATNPDPTTGDLVTNPLQVAQELEKLTAGLKGKAAQQKASAETPEARAAYSASEEAKAERGKIRSSIRDIEDKIAAEEAVQASGIRGPKFKESQAAMTRLQTQLQRRQAELEQYSAPAATPQTPTGQRPPLGDIFGGR